MGGGKFFQPPPHTAWHITAESVRFCELVVACTRHAVELSDGFPNGCLRQRRQQTADRQAGAAMCSCAKLVPLNIFFFFIMSALSLPAHVVFLISGDLTHDEVASSCVNMRILL